MRKSKGSATRSSKTKRAPDRQRAPKTNPTKKRPPRLSADEIERRLSIARGAAQKIRIDRGGLQQRLARTMELAQTMASEIGFPSVLKIAFPPRTHASQWRSPWAIVGRFIWRSVEVGYAALYRILSRWAQRRLESKVGRERISRIVVAYVTERGKREEYTLAETGPWVLTLARAREECDPTDTDSDHGGGRIGSLAARYDTSKIESVYVWWSESSARFVAG